MMRYVLVISILFILGCVYDPPEDVIAVNNTTDSVMYVYCSNADSMHFTPSIRLFDTSIENNKIIINSPPYRLNPHSYGTASEMFFTEKEFKSGVYLFYITENILKTRSWDDIVKQKLFVKKAHYSLKALKEANYRVAY